MSNLRNFTARELTSKHACLMDDVEKLPPGTQISPKKVREIKAFEQELQHRLYSLMIGNVFPVIITAKED